MDCLDWIVNQTAAFKVRFLAAAVVAPSCAPPHLPGDGDEGHKLVALVPDQIVKLFKIPAAVRELGLDLDAVG